MRRIALVVNWRRAAVVLPLLIGFGAAAAWYLPGKRDSSTPRAALVATPPQPGVTVGVRKGDLARDFAGRAPDGTPVRLSDLRGKPTVINFWATWCTSCLAELPDLKAVQQQVGADKLNVLAINAGEDSGTAKNFLDHLGASTFRVGMDPTLVVADAYGVFGLPQSVFVDARGVIRAVYTGQLSRDLMQQYVRAAEGGTDGADPPSKLRLITTVARDHTLEVRRTGTDTVEFRSKSLRCDDTYCATAAVDALARVPGMRAATRYLSEDPPRVVVAFDLSRTDPDALTAALVRELGTLHDPLYERPLEVIRD